MYALCRFAPKTPSSVYSTALLARPPARSFSTYPSQASRVTDVAGILPKNELTPPRPIDNEFPKSKKWAHPPFEYDSRYIKSDSGILTAVFLLSLTGVMCIGEKSEAEKKEERMVQEDLERQAQEKRQRALEAAQRKKLETENRKNEIKNIIVNRLIEGDLRTVREWLDEGRINLREHTGLWHSMMYEYSNEFAGSKVEALFFLNAKIPERVNERDSNGKTPLYHAVKATLPNHVSILLEETNAVFDVDSADWKTDMLNEAKAVLKYRRKQSKEKSDYILGTKVENVSYSSLYYKKVTQKKEDEAKEVLQIIKKYCASK